MFTDCIVAVSSWCTNVVTSSFFNSSKKVNKVKKAGSQLKNGLPSPGHNKDTQPTAQKVSDGFACCCFANQ